MPAKPKRSEEEWYDRILEALRAVKEGSVTPTSLGDSLFYQQIKGNELTERIATNKVLEYLLDAVRPYQTPGVDYVHDQYFKGLEVADVARIHETEPRKLEPIKATAILEMACALKTIEKSLAPPDVYELDAALHTRLLPPPDARLLGIETILQELTPLLVGPNAVQLLMLTGVGGLGKTTIASALVRHLMEAGHFEAGAWVSAQQVRLLPDGTVVDVPNPTLTSAGIVSQLAEQILGKAFMENHRPQSETVAALYQALKTTRYLIGIDNLETLADAQAVLEIARKLAWRSRSQFLFTSREKPPERAVKLFPVRPLSRAEADQLLMQEAAYLEGHALALLAATERDLALVYDKLGGNPLALHLFVGQVESGSLDTVLALLMRASGTQAQNLYTYIYYPAWQKMDANTQKVFMAMPVIMARGDKAGHISDITELPLDVVQPALHQLVRQNLIEGYTLNGSPTYRIHPLTHTFLTTTRLPWKETETFHSL